MEDNSENKPFVFVLMPFSTEFTDLYLNGIKPACESVGVDCERVDEKLLTESILERIYSHIRQADLIVAEMTNLNPNVFYEVGYAHALYKQVILLIRDAGDIPFDLKHYQPMWGAFVSAKRHYDPDGILTPGPGIFK